MKFRDFVFSPTDDKFLKFLILYSVAYLRKVGKGFVMFCNVNVIIVICEYRFYLFLNRW